MSYDIYLRDPCTNEVLELDEPHHMRGGTYAIGGTTRLHLNVTYNYCGHFLRVFQPTRPNPYNHFYIYENAEYIHGIRTLYGLTGAESISVLNRAIESLKADVTDNYWEPTEGNAKRALMQLRAMAIMRPDGVWDGD